VLDGNERNEKPVTRPISLTTARFRLVSLWLSQVARFLADYCLRIFVVLYLAAQGSAERDAAWHLAAALFMMPSVFLVPIYGASANSLPKRGSLIGSAAYCFAVVLVLGFLGEGWLICLGLVALGSALCTPTRYALLPPAAEDAAVPLGRVVAFIETGAAPAIVGGMSLGGALMPVDWLELSTSVGMRVTGKSGQMAE
jgi:MFS family permease